MPLDEFTSNSKKGESLNLTGATLPFRQYHLGNRWLIEFDSTGFDCPVPMVNAMVGLEHIAGNDMSLVMINGFEPEGLYERAASYFTWTVKQLSLNQVKICFTAVDGRVSEMNFLNKGCKG